MFKLDGDPFTRAQRLVLIFVTMLGEVNLKTFGGQNNAPTEPKSSVVVVV